MQSWNMWCNVLNGMTMWSDLRCKSPNAPQRYVMHISYFCRLSNWINASHSIFTCHTSSTINSLHHQWPFLMYWCTRIDRYFTVLFVLTRYFDSSETLVFRRTLKLIGVKSEEIWPLIKTCISSNRVRANTHVRNCALHKQLYPIHQSCYR